MSRVEAWRCQWPTNWALAAPEALAVLVTEGAAGVEGASVVEDVPVPDMFFEHPAADTVTIPAMAMINPDFTTRGVIWLSLQSLATTPWA
jgi:hypothetical protein